MKRFLAPLALLALPFSLSAQELPASSPAASVSQRIGLTDVTITYSRPSAKGRRVFGDLVPFGEVWRTGANACTVLETRNMLLINGQKLPPGKYSVFTVPGVEVWQIMFNSQTDLWGAMDRKPEMDVLIVPKVITRPAEFTETFNIGFESVSGDKAELVLSWEKLEVVVNIEAPSDDQAMANIREALAKPDADYRAYARCASYCLDKGVETKSALEWAQKSVDLDKKYWNTFTLAKAQAAHSRYKEAAATGKEAVALAIAEKDSGAQKAYQAKVDEWSAMANGK
ncbi:MAG: DUF2911 domain-containing protein [Flavobacteriales bacterium]|nr:DUF2911 domain-containing protein [Flavobacteriales bacterium]